MQFPLLFDTRHKFTNASYCFLTLFDRQYRLHKTCNLMMKKKEKKKAQAQQSIGLETGQENCMVKGVLLYHKGSTIFSTRNY